ncbi:alanine racemase [Neisseriaceae bacterium JH1-16]|nr:alanine racemase [Neisseriaceae bacterium JH1-16]
MRYPVFATFDNAALLHNFALAEGLLGDTGCYVVGKSDAYGHGLLRMAACLGNRAAGYAVIQMADAERLRRAGFTGDILLLEGVQDAAELCDAEALGLTLVVHAPHQLALLEASRAPLSVWLKVNTGMNRFGFAPERVPEVLARLAVLSHLRLRGLMTHFANADNLDSGIDVQWQRFAPLVAESGLPFSAANTAAALRYPQTRGAWARLGALLYGNNVFYPDRRYLPDTRPVLALCARVVSVSTLEAGDSLGYGATFTAERPMRVAVLGCGYGDGYPRQAPNGTPVLLHGQRVGLVGRVAMNAIAVDVSALASVQVGDVATLWGAATLGADEVAAHCGTVGEELQCALTNRVPVVVLNAEESAAA